MISAGETDVTRQLLAIEPRAPSQRTHFSETRDPRFPRLPALAAGTALAILDILPTSRYLFSTR